MCGEMAGDARYTPLLLGLGLREFSMHPGSLLEVKDRLRRCDVQALATALSGMLEHMEDLAPHALLERLESLH
jgi:phosphotransferase system enzyme I (PtsI)